MHIQSSLSLDQALPTSEKVRDVREKTPMLLNRIVSKETFNAITETTNGIMRTFNSLGKKAEAAILSKASEGSDLVKSVGSIFAGISKAIINTAGIALTLAAYLGEAVVALVLSPVLIGLYINSKKDVIAKALGKAALKTKEVLAPILPKLESLTEGAAEKTGAFLEDFSSKFKPCLNKMGAYFCKLLTKADEVALSASDGAVRVLGKVRDHIEPTLNKLHINFLPDEEVGTAPTISRKRIDSVGFADHDIINSSKSEKYSYGTVLKAGLQNEGRSTEELLPQAFWNKAAADFRLMHCS